MRFLQKYFLIYRVEWALMLAYRAESVIWMLGALVQPIVSMAIWMTISSQNTGGQIAGFSTRDFVVYFLGVMVVERLTRAWNVWNVDSEIREGTFTPKLLRPFHPIHWEINQNLVYKFFYMLLMVPVWLVAAWFVPMIRIEIDGVSFLWFVLIIILSSALRFVICQLFGYLAFWTNRAVAMYLIFEMVHFFLAGRIAPMALFPDWLQALNQWLPFYYSVGFPVDLLCGKLAGHPDVILHGVLVLTAWTVALCGLLWWQWRAGVKQYGAIGG